MFSAHSATENTDRSPVADLVAQSEISRLVYNIANSQDYLDWALFASCWTDQEPLKFDLSGHLANYEIRTMLPTDLVSTSHEALSGFEGTQHALSNLLIDLHPTSSNESVYEATATARTYITAFHYISQQELQQIDAKLTDTKAIMRGSWNVSVGKERASGKWKALGIQVARLVPIEGDEKLYDAAKMRVKLGKGRSASTEASA